MRSVVWRKKGHCKSGAFFALQKAPTKMGFQCLNKIPNEAERMETGICYRVDFVWVHSCVGEVETVQEVAEMHAVTDGLLEVHGSEPHAQHRLHGLRTTVTTVSDSTSSQNTINDFVNFWWKIGTKRFDQSRMCGKGVGNALKY